MNISGELAKLLNSNENKGTKPYDTKAIVKRVENGIAWVHIPGGVDETPAQLTINAKPGDSVQVRVADGKAFLVGNGSAPPTDDTTARQAIDFSKIASDAANAAVQDASKARTAADSAQAAADHAEEVAEGVEAIAESAKTAADTAFSNLSQVQSVLEVAQWIATHGTYVKATVFNPNATYYTITATQVAEPSDDDKDSQGVLIYYELDNGIYVRTTDTSVQSGKTYYRVTGTPVAQPVAEDIADYYTLAVNEAMADYVQSHLALTDDGLYVMKDGSLWKVKISDDGVYILDPNNNPANQMTANGNVIGYEDETHMVLEQNSFSIAHDYELKSVIMLGGLEEVSKNDYISSLNPTQSLTLSASYRPFKRNSTIRASWAGAEVFFTSNVAGEETIDGITISYDGAYSFNFESTEAKTGTARIEYTYINKWGSLVVDGDESRVTSQTAFSLGQNTINSNNSAAIGEDNSVSGIYSLAAGYRCSINNGYSIATGRQTIADGSASFAANRSTHAGGTNSSAFGNNSSAGQENQFSIGKYNDNQTDTAFEIGNGESERNRSNAFTVDWNGIVRARNKANRFSDIFDLLRPVWSTYSTLDPNFNPNVSWGGTWEKLPEGYILLSGSESGSYQVGTDITTSGYKEYGENSHVLTSDEIPAHTHGNKSLSGSFQARHYGTSGNGAQLVFNRSGIVTIDSNTGTLGKINVGGAGSNGGYEVVTVNASHEHDSVGGGQAHSLMQKSIAVYTWIRTA